jgi:hypothetical protein
MEIISTISNLTSEEIKAISALVLVFSTVVLAISVLSYGFNKIPDRFFK